MWGRVNQTTPVLIKKAVVEHQGKLKYQYPDKGRVGLRDGHSNGEQKCS